MQKTEKRQKQRISSIHLLNYVSLDQNYQEIGQGMGRTINMSETGLLIETPYAIDPQHFLSLNVGLAEERFKVHGKVVYSTPISENNYRTGIRFNQAPKADYYVFRNLLSSLNNNAKDFGTAPNKSVLAAPVPLLKSPPCDYLYVVEEETYLTDEKIVNQGNYGNWVWVILDGWATIVRETPNGNMAVFKIGPGGFIGSSMSYLVSNYARSNSVIASGNIQLGLLDTQRMLTEHASLSPEFKDVLISMSGRLKRLIDRIVLLRQGQNAFKEDLLDGKLLSDMEKNESGLHHIMRGKATLLSRNLTNEIPLVNLYPGDYIGSLPFIKDEFEPNFMVTRTSTSLKKKELHRGSLKTEFENLSQTMKNLIEFSSTKIIAASHIVERLSTLKSQII